MEAVILAGGRGTRLQPLTISRPKPLLPLAGRPLIERILDTLPAEVDLAIVAAGYLVDQMRSWAARTDHRVAVEIVEETAPLGTAGALDNVSDSITGDILCFNGDIISSVPIPSLIAQRAAMDALGSLALWRVDDPSHFGVVGLEGDRITSFIEKPPAGSAPSDLINAGTYCFDRAILDMIPSGKASSLERDIFPRALADGAVMSGLIFTGHWVDCGRPDAYLEAHRLVMDGPLWLSEGASMEGELAGFASLGEGARIRAGAVVDDVVLFDGATVKGHATVRRTILGAGASIGPNALVEDCVLADGARVMSGDVKRNERIGG